MAGEPSSIVIETVEITNAKITPSVVATGASIEVSAVVVTGTKVVEAQPWQSGEMQSGEV